MVISPQFNNYYKYGYKYISHWLARFLIACAAKIPIEFKLNKLNSKTSLSTSHLEVKAAQIKNLVSNIRELLKE